MRRLTNRKATETSARIVTDTTTDTVHGWMLFELNPGKPGS
jgi:hypothetical protein